MWLVCCLVPMFAIAQEPFYLLYNPSCMDVYEYRYAYTNQSVTSFSARPNAYDQFIFSAGEGSIKARTLPAGTVNCKDLSLDDSFVDAVNSLSRPMYIVQQDQSGYLMTPVIMATRIQRAGNGYALRSLSYNFFFDPQNNNPANNLAIAGSQSYVYYRGNQIRSCQNEYAFHRDPLAKGGETSDFEFVPGVGVTSDKTGRNAQEAQNNHLLLHKINDRLLNDHIATACGGNQNVANQTGTTFVGPPVIENREDASSTGVTTPGTPIYTTSGDCAQQSGPGYHVVQRGETLMSLSRRYNIPLRTLIASNNLADPDHLQVCQIVQLGKPKTSAVKKSASSKKSTAKAAPRPKSYSEMVSDNTPAVTYSTTAPLAYRPAAQKHLVQPGESLASVARKYGYTEARLREMNNFTQDGLITLSPGTELIINDCNCNTTGAAQPQTTYSAPLTYTTTTTVPQPVTTPSEPVWSGTPSSNKPLEQLYFETPVAGNNAPQTTTAPPVTTTTTPVFTQQAGGNTTTPPMVYNTTPQTSTPAPTQPQPETQRKPEVSYLEHYVQQGETISSIAIRFKVSPQEVALVNGKEVSETLIAGQRLLVPRY
jgi:LysM repeat protein